MDDCIKNEEVKQCGIICKQQKEFVYEEDAVGVVEIILILVVLISLVIIFKEQLSKSGTCNLK